MSEIGFDIYDDSGTFLHGDANDAGAEKLNDLLERKEGENLSDASFISELKNIVKRYPDFMDGHAHLGYALLEAGDSAAGLKSCLHAVRMGEGAIPEGFEGPLQDYSMGNRPFFRAVHGAILCNLDLGERKPAIEMMKKMLKWCPNDSYGIRLMIGSEYLGLGMDREALPYLKENAGHFPPYQYDLGLYYWRACDFGRAATVLRRAFIGNVYIAEMLFGNPCLSELQMCHISNRARSEIASEYVDRFGKSWKENGEAMLFLTWLYNHPEVIAERKAAFECLEDLVGETRVDERTALRKRYEWLVAQIDDELSERITAEQTNASNGKIMLPWQAFRH